MRKTSFAGIILFGMVIDMSSKYIAELYLRNPVSIFQDWIQLKLEHNSGIAFSLPIGGLLLQIITLVLIFGIIVYYSNTEKSKKSKLLDF